MADNNIVYPTDATLRKYGLTLQEWLTILELQGNVCPICKKAPSSGRFVVDHEHARGYRRMKPEERRKRVRGICCFYCNRYFLSKGITAEKARNIIEYLEAYAGLHLANQLGWGARMLRIPYPDDTKDPDNIRTRLGKITLLSYLRGE